MSSNNYAPVIIPTLCRYEHFHRCLESLENCIGSDKTDVYIGLDFPPSKKYYSGWKMIDNYLTLKEKDNRFRKFVVFRRSKNCGMFGEGNNMQLLCNSIKERDYNRYIFSEDDNEFSPNFLEYMNKALYAIRGTNIKFVTGYTHMDMQIPDNFSCNIFKSKAFSAWGYGVWLEDEKDYERYSNFRMISNIVKDKTKCRLLSETRPDSIRSMVNMLKYHDITGDTLHSIYMILENCYCLFPTVSKVKNHGSDGSGIHSTVKNNQMIQKYENQVIDTDRGFAINTQLDEIAVLSRHTPLKYPHTIRGVIKYLIFLFDLFCYRQFNILFKSKYI